MTEYSKKEYLNGKFVIETLGTAPDSSGRFRNGDERGEVAMIISNSNLQHLEFAEFKKEGIKRGYHYHKSYLERLYVIAGRIVVLAKNINTEDKIEVTISEGELITIHPEIAHAFYSTEKSTVLSMGAGESPFSDRQLYKELSFSFE